MRRPDDDGKLTVPGELATTMMACPDELQAQDEWLASLLTSEPALSLEGDTLVIGDSTTGMTLETRKDLPLQGTVWTVDGLIANEAISTVPIGVEATVEIDAQGTAMTVSAGCNTGSGSVTIETGTDASSGTITVGPVATTRKFCAEDAMAVETLVLSVLQGPVTYEIDGDSLKLTNGDEGLTFKGASD